MPSRTIFPPGKSNTSSTSKPKTYEGKPIDKYTSEEVNYFKERDKYVNEHKNRYINLYEKELSVYGFEVKFVN